MHSQACTIDLGSDSRTSAIIAYPDGFTEAQRYDVVILAHGAGNDMHSSFLTAMQEGLAQRGLVTLKFNFPYKERGGKAPDPGRVLQACYAQVVDYARRTLAPRRLIIGGKSMGGRMASHLAANGVPVDGLLFLGYPLHPAGKPEQLRVTHLEQITAPMLFFAGTRDPLCKLDLLQSHIERLQRDHGAKITLHIIQGADHSFDVLKSLKRSADEVRREIIEATVQWIGGLGR